MKATDFLALYGAVISTGVLLWNVTWAIRSARSHVRVSLTPAYGFVKGQPVDGYLVTIVNPSPVKITLFELTVLHETRHVSPLKHFWNRRIGRKTSLEGWLAALLTVEGYDPPIDLAPGEAREFIAPLGVVTAATGGPQTIRVGVRDGLFRRYYSEPVTR